MAKPSFRAPKGTRDLLPPESARQRLLIDTFARRVELAGYGLVESPIFEELDVFLRLGESTDVVSKEMFTFSSKSEKDPVTWALRPELTASIARAYVQHRPPTPWKAWYQGPQFRYERPQAGRYRQFTQVGIEALGTADPAVDVEVIGLAADFYRDLGLSQVTLLLNSLGDPTCRPVYMTALTEYFTQRAGDLSEQSQHTLQVNPLRVLDSKREQDQAIIDDAPVMVDYLSPETAEHFAGVRSGLDSLGVSYEISPRLVRGLDYYTRTTFEFASTAIEAAQNAVGGGGRYDSLVADLGGPDTPGIGFALGVDRILMACDAEGTFPNPDGAVRVFIVDTVDGTRATALAHRLRSVGIGADRAFDARSMKSQMKAADRSGAAWGVIIGDDEVSANEVTLRDLRGETGQHRVPSDDIVEALAKRLH